MSASSAVPDRDKHTYCQIGDERNQSCGQVQPADKYNHKQRSNEGDENRGDSVCEEYLEQFDVRGDDLQEISLVTSLELGRAKASQSCKGLMPDQCQYPKRYVVVAVLLTVVQDAA